MPLPCPQPRPGRVIWITGLSGAGKSTLARALWPLLPVPRLLLDGDELREALALVAGGYSRAERLNLALTYARLARLAAAQGQTVVCATISMFQAVRDWNRQNLPGYFEIFINPPPELLQERDYKGVYQQNSVIGQDLSAELPRRPDLTLTGAGNPAQEAAVVAELLGLEEK